MKIRIDVSQPRVAMPDAEERLASLLPEKSFKRTLDARIRLRWLESYHSQASGPVLSADGRIDVYANEQTYQQVWSAESITGIDRWRRTDQGARRATAQLAVVDMAFVPALTYSQEPTRPWTTRISEVIVHPNHPRFGEIVSILGIEDISMRELSDVRQFLSEQYVTIIVGTIRTRLDVLMKHFNAWSRSNRRDGIDEAQTFERVLDALGVRITQDHVYALGIVTKSEAIEFLGELA